MFIWSTIKCFSTNISFRGWMWKKCSSTTISFRDLYFDTNALPFVFSIVKDRQFQLQIRRIFWLHGGMQAIWSRQKLCFQMWILFLSLVCRVQFRLSWCRQRQWAPAPDQPRDHRHRHLTLLQSLHIHKAVLFFTFSTIPQMYLRESTLCYCYFKSFMYLAMPGLACSMWNLYLWHENISLWHVGSSSLIRD